MGPGRQDSIQVLPVGRFPDGNPVFQKVIDLQIVFFLEPVGIQALVVFLGIIPVFDHLVDEKQAQDLDALREQTALFFQMCPDGLADLDAAQHVFLKVSQ